MSTALGILSALFWGVIVLSLLVFLHEGGHYLAARAFNVRATEFFLGLPCRLRLSRRSRSVGTEFGVTPILLGGYTRICGMEGASDELLSDALAIVMREGRVSAADVGRELNVGGDRTYRLLATLSDWASIRPYYDPELGERPDQGTYPAAFETLARDGAHRTEYDRGHDFSTPGSTAAGQPHPLGMSAGEFLELERSHTYLGVGFLRRVAMLVAGPLVNVALAFVLVTAAYLVQEYRYSPNVSTVGSVAQGSVAAAAGVEEGDTITRVGDTSVETWDELAEALAPHLSSGTDVELTCEREGAERTVLLDLPDGEATEDAGLLPVVVSYHLTLPQAVRATVSYTVRAATYVSQLIQPAHTMEVLDQSSSIVGISAMASQAASDGPFSLMVVVAAVSMSLGFMNLLPIPPFDGGKILIEVIQLVIRRPLGERAQTALNYLGLAFILFVFVVVLRNDIVRFVF
ncbi:M50 family metallopeptidase [Thermophilibacter mediterraneus]|uniref:M50 family metallopeptidase n=1 Tax=Thermophilibacter mediterraneus TaxID=1871031 RepID=UPI0009304F19|nr:site-2 protease family protein [Thermophilibacter mediterraneus]